MITVIPKQSQMSTKDKIKMIPEQTGASRYNFAIAFNKSGEAETVSLFLYA